MVDAVRQRGKLSRSNLREEEGVSLMAGKGSKEPCSEADSFPRMLTSGLSLPFTHLRMGEVGGGGGMGEGLPERGRGTCSVGV